MTAWAQLKTSQPPTHPPSASYASGLSPASPGAGRTGRQCEAPPSYTRELLPDPHRRASVLGQWAQPDRTGKAELALVSSGCSCESGQALPGPMVRPPPLPQAPTAAYLWVTALIAACKPTAGGSCCWPSRPCGWGWRPRWPGAPPLIWCSAGPTLCHSCTPLWVGPGSARSDQPPPLGPVLGGRGQVWADGGPRPTPLPPPPQSPGLGPLHPARHGLLYHLSHLSLPGPACRAPHPAGGSNGLGVASQGGGPSPRSPACSRVSRVSALRWAWAAWLPLHPSTW